MCNDYEQHIAWKAYCEMMQAMEWQVPTHQSELDLPQADDIKITDLAPVLGLVDGKPLLSPMMFSWAGPRGPVFNFVGDGRRFAAPARRVVPASAFFEFTGKKSPKAKHRFTLNDAPFMGIAAIWREQPGNKPPGFAMLTTHPGPDVAPIHDRQIVVLHPEQWRPWLEGAPEPEFIRPLPAGTLSVETVRPGSD